MKKISAVLSLLLALMTVFALVACGNNANGPETTVGADTGAEATAEDTSNLYDEDGYLRDDLDSYNLNYNGTEIHILFDKAQMTKTYADSYTADILNDALYSRILEVEKRLNVKLDFIALEGAWAKRAEFAQEVERVYQAGTKDYDLVCAYNLTPPTMAVNGTLTNLMDLEYLNFDKPWWPPQLLEQSVYKGKLFFCADNSSWNVIRNMHVIAYNTALVEEYSIDDPMQTVLDGGWTMELLKQYIEGTYLDLNGNQKIDIDEDRFGLATDTAARMDGYFFAAGLTITKVENDTPVFALADESVQNFVEYMQDLYARNPEVVMDTKQYQMFKDQRAVFYQTAIAIADQKLEFGYGLLPMPKFNPEQDGYITGMSNTYDMWCIPKRVNDENMSAAVLECLASEAYRKVAPMYFETMLKFKYSSSSKAGGVFDKIRDGMVFDFGYVYGNNFSEAPFISIRKCYTDASANWSVKWKAIGAANEKTLAEILEKLEMN